jgi:ankyrin repeat protein
MARIRTAGLALAALFPIVCRADMGEDLLAAVRKSDAARVQALLAQGADVNFKSPYGATGLFFAADRGNLEIVKILLDHGADASVKDTFYGATATAWAAMKQHVEVIRLLWTKSVTGADDVLNSGVENGNIEMVRLALEHKKDIPPDTLSEALASAVKESHAEIAELLKNNGAVLPVKPNFPVDAETLKSYAGTYVLEGDEVKFEVVNGKLMGGWTGGQAAPFDAIDKFTFQHSEYAGLKVTFRLEQGKVVSLTLTRDGGKPAVFQKMGNQ